MGQGMAWGWHMPPHVPGAGHAGQGWRAQPPIHDPDQRVSSEAEGGEVLPPGTASTDTAESVYLGGYFLEVQKSAKKF